MCVAFVAPGGSCIEIWKLGRRSESSHGRPLFGAFFSVSLNIVDWCVKHRSFCGHRLHIWVARLHSTMSALGGLGYDADEGLGTSGCDIVGRMGSSDL